MERNIRIISLRTNAEDMVGECSDYQIMFCASAAGKISKMALTLSDLSDVDLDSLYNWMMNESFGIDVNAFTYKRTYNNKKKK